MFPKSGHGVKNGSWRRPMLLTKKSIYSLAWLSFYLYRSQWKSLVHSADLESVSNIQTFQGIRSNMDYTRNVFLFFNFLLLWSLIWAMEMAAMIVTTKNYLPYIFWFILLFLSNGYETTRISRESRGSAEKRTKGTGMCKYYTSKSNCQSDW